MTADQIGQLYPFKPDYTVPPGTTLREALGGLEMSQAQLALRTGLSLKHVNQIVHGLAPLTHETSLALERVTGIPARFWNTLEVNHRDQQARLQEREISAEDRTWLSSLPIRELAKRGKLDPTADPPSLLQQIYRFFGVNSRDAWEKVWRVPLASFRRSPSFKSDMPALASWLRLGELEAADVRCARFDAKKFKGSLKTIRALTRADSPGEDLVRLCADSGVAVVFVAEIKGCRASGAARWITAAKALIQLSDRHKRDDHFWFSFFHEAGHILNHGKRQTFVTNGDEGDVDEEDANRFSATTLVPKAFEAELRSLRTAGQIEAFAERIGIAPGIVVGRLQREKLITYSTCNSLKRKVHIREARGSQMRRS